MNLLEIEENAWSTLDGIVGDPKSALRNMNLCSVDQLGRPQARIVILRSVDRTSRTLEFHTDVRSSKWQQLSSNPTVTVLGYCSIQRLQLRFMGKAELFSPATSAANETWQSLPHWTRSTYQGGPPGDELAFGDEDTDVHIETTTIETGQDQFGVIKVTVSSLDWFQLQRQNNKRAEFTYDQESTQVSARWINP